MFLSDEVMTLANIGGGAAETKFQAELRRVLENMMDQDTDYKKTRKIIIELSFTPNEARDTALIIVDSKCKLALHKA